MNDSHTNKLTDAQCVALLDALLPLGFAGDDVLDEIAPGGWENSPLAALFHPAPEQLYEESVRIHRNLQSLRRADDSRPISPEPTREAFLQGFRQQPVEAEREIRELIGMCAWDLFSDNHEVTAADGREVDLGSFRGAGEFLADYLNRNLEHEKYDYVDFYMGTIRVRQRADLTPVYELIFRRFQRQGLDWVYHFPKLHLIDVRPLRDSLKRDDEPEWLNYSPSEALAKEQEERQRDQQIAEMRQSLEQDYREAIRQALQSPPPKTVQAYQKVYGRWPAGWPPRV